ncbi:hypothetical protein C8Q77DRAFT_655243 [Trametes polyzona]|nr:hypothetical protein C8Q77DRAFT_655243 [Trametes polyzona]
MLSALIDIFVPRSFSTAAVLVGTPETKSYLLHIMPESGTVERYNMRYTARVIRHNGSERSREQIGTITIHPRIMLRWANSWTMFKRERCSSGRRPSPLKRSRKGTQWTRCQDAAATWWIRPGWWTKSSALLHLMRCAIGRPSHPRRNPPWR